MKMFQEFYSDFFHTFPHSTATLQSLVTPIYSFLFFLVTKYEVLALYKTGEPLNSISENNNTLMFR